MEDDPNRFRQFAAECRRLAERSSGNDREILLEIAGTWMSCAVQAENKKQTGVRED